MEKTPSCESNDDRGYGVLRIDVALLLGRYVVSESKRSTYCSGW